MVQFRGIQVCVCVCACDDFSIRLRFGVLACRSVDRVQIEPS